MTIPEVNSALGAHMSQEGPPSIKSWIETRGLSRGLRGFFWEEDRLGITLGPLGSFSSQNLWLD